MEELGLEIVVSLPTEYQRLTRSTDPIGPDEDVVTIVDPRNDWKDDIVDPNKTPKKSDRKRPANKTDQSQKAKTLDRKKLARQKAISAAATVTTSTITTVPALMYGDTGDGGGDESIDVAGTNIKAT